MSKSVRLLIQILASIAVASLITAADLPPELATLRVKAESGNTIAQYNLGLAYLQGRDVPADFVEGYVWLSLAAENGSTGKALETLLNQMTPAQLSEGKRRLMARRGSKLAPAVVPAIAPDRAAGSSRADATKLEEEIGVLRADRARLASELAGARQEAAQAREALEFQARALAEAKAAATASTEAASARLNEIASLRSSVTRLQSAVENPEVGSRLTRVEAELKEAKAMGAELTKKNDALEAGLRRANVATTEMKARADSAVAELERQRTDRGKEEQSTAQRAAEHAQSLASARTGDAELRGRLTASAAELEETKRSLTQVRADYDSARGAVAESSREVGVLQKNLAAVEAERAALKQELATVSARATSTPKVTVPIISSYRDENAGSLTAADPVTKRAAGIAGETPGINAPVKPRIGELLAPTRPSAVPAQIAAPAPSTEKTVQPARTHTVVVGDTLSGISRRYYGTATRWAEIVSANPGVLRDERKVPVGATLEIP